MEELKENERIIEITGTLISGQRFNDYSIVEIDSEGEYDASRIYEEIKEHDAYYLPTNVGLMIYDSKLIESIEIVGPFTKEVAQERLDERQRQKEEAEKERIKRQEEYEALKKRTERYSE